MELKQHQHVYDTRLVVQNDAFPLLKASPNIMYATELASSVSPSGAVITLNIPSKETLVSRRLLLTCTFNVVVAGTNDGKSNLPMIQDGYFGYRRYALQQGISNINLVIDNASFSTPYYNALSYLHDFNSELQNRRGNMEPSMPDPTQKYADMVGFVANPLASFLNNTAEPTRNLSNSPLTTNLVNDAKATSSTFTCTLTHELSMSPFIANFNENNYSGFTRCSQIQATFNFSNLERMFSAVSGAINGVEIKTITITPTAAALTSTYLQPPANYSIPDIVKTRFAHVSVYKTLSSGEVKDGAQVSLTSQAIQFGSMPRMLLIYIAQDSQTSTAFETDGLYGLDHNDVNPLSIRITNNDKLSQINTQQLYNMSRKNGLNYSYQDFCKFRGSPILVDMARDLGLQDGEAASVINRTQFVITMRARNYRAANTPTLHVIAIETGIFTDHKGIKKTELGIFQVDEVKRASSVVRYSSLEHGGRYVQDEFGGSFLDDAVSWLRKYNVVSELASNIPVVGKIAQRVLKDKGYGYEAEGLEGKLWQEDPSMGGQREKKMSNAEIRRRIMRKV
jgi:hypothetical protein